MASSRRNSSTPVPPLGTSFNTTLRFSEPMAYPPNVPQCSRQLHQQGLSPVQSNLPGQFHLSLAQVSSLRTMILIRRMLPLLILILIIIELIDLHPLLAHCQNSIGAIILTNDWPKYSADLLTLSTLIRLLDLTLIQGELKPASPTLLAALSPTSSIISYFNAGYISVLIRRNSTQTLQKSTLQWPTLLE